MTGQYKIKSTKQGSYAKGSYQQRVQDQMERRYSMSRRNLWEVVLFLMVAIGAFTFKDFNLFEVSSESLRQVLGYPPPSYLISIALAVYCFSSASLTLTAMAKDAEPVKNWHHLGYRSVFFIFYCFSGAIAANFLPVLLGGLCLYGLDQCHIWFYNTRVIAQEKDLVEKF
ncbi:MAG: hypothetical protein OQK50_02295 [Deltaproteobacteria bacterium]|jgi:hypothetical protein|nr:hypothetical protein [Deltaproteobacteria bacterium]MCW9049146.1 hypothetical protein [Deltaproteobacteria bacterium]